MKKLTNFLILIYSKDIGLMKTIIKTILFIYIICFSIKFKKSLSTSSIPSTQLIKKEIILESNEYNVFDQIKNNETDKYNIKLLKEISIIKHIYSNEIENYKKDKNIIQILFCVNNDENYAYVSLVSMFSLLYNNDKNNTFVILHISCTPNFNKLYAKIFTSLVKNFPKNVEIILYNMGNLMINRDNPRFSQSTYYKLLPSVFIDSDRILYLDCDTIILSDLNEMYNLNFNDNYILGALDYLVNNVDYLGIKSNIYINSGVILLNLKKIREDKKVNEFLNLTDSDTFLKNNEQTVVNYVLYPKIGILPSKYVIFNFEDKLDIILYNNYLRTKLSIEELEEALRNPRIVHMVICSPKPWFVKTTYRSYFSACSKRFNCSCKKHFDLWHFYAKQTDYYEKIANFTGVRK